MGRDRPHVAEGINDRAEAVTPKLVRLGSEVDPDELPQLPDELIDAMLDDDEIDATGL